jgi:hypothetical protein
MHVNTALASQVELPGASKEAQIVLRSVRSCVLQDADTLLSDASPAGVDWEEVENIAAQNRLAVLVLRGMNQSAKAIPANCREVLEEHQNATVRMNGMGLATLRHVVPSLESRGVDTVVLKGPVAQKIIYGDFFSKPSSDLDLLVSSRDYNKASRWIISRGFALAEECSSPWWRIFLGEQHFLSAVPSRTTIDLHYRTQQPGSPAPHRTDLFMSQKVCISVGNVKIHTLSKANTCLLSCISLMKALFHREPGGGHVCDIAANILNYAPEELEKLFDDAGRQGLTNTLLLGLRSTGLLFGIRVQFDESVDQGVLRCSSDENLLRMILYPWSTEIQWPKRSRMLWDLCDNKTAYLRAISWKISGDLCRRAYQSSPRRLGRAPLC